MTNSEILYIGIYLASGIVIGWIVKMIVVPILHRVARKTKWKTDDLIIDTIAKWVIFWFFLLGCLLVMPHLELSQKNTVNIQKVISSLYIFSVTWIIARILSGMLDIRSSKDDSVIPSTSIIGNIARVIVYCVGIMVILQVFGVSITPILTALGVGGIAVALALQPTLSNLFSGLQIIASGKINVGDFVQLENGQKGFIKDITWRNTTIETVQNNVIIVPNRKMDDSIVENFFLANKEITFFVQTGVGYESNLEKVERVSIEVAKQVLQKHDGGVKEFEPFVRFFNFGDSSIDLKIFLRVKEYADQFMITSEFIKALHKRYNEEGINIPFPIRTVVMKNRQPE